MGMFFFIVHILTQMIKITFSAIIFLVWMFEREGFAIYYIFLLDI